MKILVASDSFKGSLTSQTIGNLVEEIANQHFHQPQVIKIPMADGGEGTVESLVHGLNGILVETKVKNPLGNEIMASYGIVNKDCAIIEMATASGLPLVKEEERNVLSSNTFGTGELVLDAMNRGCKKIYLGIGGSATNDGGIGLAAALGVKFLDIHQQIIEPIPKNFKQICSIDLEEIHPKLAQTQVMIMSDVKNPLLGANGATAIYGPQKGVTKELESSLEEGLKHYIELVERSVNKPVRAVEGAGAAGGLGAGLLAFTNASMKSGVEQIIEILELEKRMESVDLVITGEGRMDYQSAYGKVAYGVGMLAKKKEVPCIAIVGSVGESAEEMYNHGITSIIPIVNDIMTLDFAIKNAKELYKQSLVSIFNIMKIKI